jgi:hypothetical protein
MSCSNQMRAAFENRYRASKQAEAQASAMMWFIESRTSLLRELVQEVTVNIHWHEASMLDQPALEASYRALSQYEYWLENLLDIWKNRANGSQWVKEYNDIQELWYAIRVFK